MERNRAALDRAAVALLQTETLNEPEIAVLKQQVAVDGSYPATLPHPIQDLERPVPQRKWRPAVLPWPCLKGYGALSGLCRVIGATLVTASRPA